MYKKISTTPKKCGIKRDIVSSQGPIPVRSLVSLTSAKASIQFHTLFSFTLHETKALCAISEKMSIVLECVHTLLSLLSKAQCSIAMTLSLKTAQS